MIDPREIRIGNYLTETVDGKSYETQLELKDFAWLELAGGEERYDPIPITPEWLERFLGGSPHFNGTCLCEVVEDIWLRYNEYGEGGIFIEEYNEGAKELPHIKYVHQLQNLYFALTGSELTITEKEKA